MIISHEHRFIFIKTAKTASSSMEIALSKYCGKDDVITPMGPRDEALRSELGYRGPQNYKLPLRAYDASDWYRLLRHGTPLAYWNHVDAAFIRRHLDPELWHSYFKFCFERNPWDKVVSFYFYELREMDTTPSLSEFIQSGRASAIRGFQLYSIGNEIVVDEVFLYERLQEAAQELERRLKLPGKLELPVTKSGYRKDRRSYREILSQEDRERIRNAYAREIAHFGYAW